MEHVADALRARVAVATAPNATWRGLDALAGQSLAETVAQVAPGVPLTSTAAALAGVALAAAVCAAVRARRERSGRSAPPATHPAPATRPTRAPAVSGPDARTRVRALADAGLAVADIARQTGLSRELVALSLHLAGPRAARR
jgi:hypothetical protein